MVSAILLVSIIGGMISGPCIALGFIERQAVLVFIGIGLLVLAMSSVVWIPAIAS